MDESSTDISASDHAFRPFFVKIQDSYTGEFHHPYVHYVFSDDELDLLTNSVLKASEQHAQGDLPVTKEKVPDSTSDKNRSSIERSIIVNVAGKGQTLQSAQSLSDEWQITETSLANAPTFEYPSESPPANLMMVIEGRGLVQLENGDTSTEDALSIDDPRNIHPYTTLSDRLVALASRYNEDLEMLRAITHELVDGK